MRPLVIGMKETASLLGVSLPTVYRLAEEGGLPVIPLGGRFKVSVAKLEAMIGETLTAERIAAASEAQVKSKVAVA